MILVVSTLLGIILPQCAFGACGFERVFVSGTAEEVEDACRAIDQVLSYFRNLGYKPDPEVSILFQEHVEIDMYQHGYEPRAEQPAGKSEVSGYYDFRHKELQITSGRGILRDRKPWGIVWGESIAYSILQHELTHAIVANMLGSRYRKLGRAWHEFIAYSVQFELMDRDLRSNVLRNYPDAEPFRYVESVNAIVHAADPDAFGVSAYLFTEVNGGPDFIQRILAGNVSFSTDDFDCLWVK